MHRVAVVQPSGIHAIEYISPFRVIENTIKSYDCCYTQITCDVRRSVNSSYSKWLARWITCKRSRLVNGAVSCVVISAAIRAETEWTVPKTVVAELYGTGNLGWDVGDDGNAPDPINDHPKGNPLYFPSNDAQHPNDTGHVDWMWGLVYLPGLIAARNPIVTTQPNNKSVSEGLTATFDIAVLGTTETFQWEINTGSGWSTISGATSDSYTTGTLSLGNSGWLYRCKIDNAVGTTYSRIASLTVTLGPTGIGSASIGSTFIIG